MLTNTFGRKKGEVTGEWRRLYDLKSSLNIFRSINFRRI